MLPAWVWRVSLLWNTIQYDTRCYFNVCSEADTSQVNLPTEPTANMWKTEKKLKKVKKERYRAIYFQCLCYLALPLMCIVSMHLTRCILWRVVCVSYSFVFLKSIVFEAAIYANKDVYIFSEVSVNSPGNPRSQCRRTSTGVLNQSINQYSFITAWQNASQQLEAKRQCS